MSLQLLRTESIKNKQEICELEKELTETTKDLEQISNENSEVCTVFVVLDNTYRHAMRARNYLKPLRLLKIC